MSLIEAKAVWKRTDCSVTCLMISYLLVVEQHRTQIVIHALLKCQQENLYHEQNNSLKTKLSLLPKKLFRIRMSRNFGMKMLTMTNLSTECLIQLTKLGYDATPFNQILKQNAKREMRLRLGKVTVADVLAA